MAEAPVGETRMAMMVETTVVVVVVVEVAVDTVVVVAEAEATAAAVASEEIVEVEEASVVTVEAVAEATVVAVTSMTDVVVADGETKQPVETPGVVIMVDLVAGVREVVLVPQTGMVLFTIRTAGPIPASLATMKEEADNSKDAEAWVLSVVEVISVFTKVALSLLLNILPLRASLTTLLPLSEERKRQFRLHT